MRWHRGHARGRSPGERGGCSSGPSHAWTPEPPDGPNVQQRLRGVAGIGCILAGLTWPNDALSHQGRTQMSSPPSHLETSARGKALSSDAESKNQGTPTPEEGDNALGKVHLDNSLGANLCSVTGSLQPSQDLQVRTFQSTAPTAEGSAGCRVQTEKPYRTNDPGPSIATTQKLPEKKPRWKRRTT